MYRRLFDDVSETRPQDEIARISERNLLKQLDYIYRNSDFYRRKFEKAGITPLDISSLDDFFQKVPFLTKEEMRGDQQKHPPWGSYLTAPMEECVQIFATSGTTGTAVKSLLTKRDLDNLVRLCAKCYWSVGIRPNDIVQNTHNYAVFIGGILNHLGMQYMGAAVIATGTGRTLRQLDIMKQFGSTVLFSTPSYALYIAKTAEENNIDIRDLKIRLIVGGGEPGYLIPNVANRIKKVWNIKKVGDLLGANEWGMIAFACESESCLHAMEDYGLFEIINPDSGHPVKEGEVGELVLTHLDREAHPLIRFRTGDLVRKEDSICTCGRTSRIFPGGIIGRVDDMIKVRGVKIFPSTIDETLGGIKGLSGEYQIVVDRELDELDSFLLKVEYKQEVKEIEGLKREILKELSRTILLKPDLEMVPEGTLPKWATKAKRIFDKRNEKEFKEYVETQRRLGE